MADLYDHLELLGARVLARPLVELDTTPGGIIRPDTARIPQNRAVVEAVGPGDLVDGVVRPVPVAPGDVVYYQKFAGAWITLDERERLLLMVDEIQARLPADRVRLVSHEGGKTEHLEGESCQLCFQQRETPGQRDGPRDA